jgi:hypothetical protein
MSTLRQILNGPHLQHAGTQHCSVPRKTLWQQHALLDRVLGFINNSRFARDPSSASVGKASVVPLASSSLHEPCLRPHKQILLLCTTVRAGQGLILPAALAWFHVQWLRNQVRPNASPRYTLGPGHQSLDLRTCLFVLHLIHGYSAGLAITFNHHDFAWVQMRLFRNPILACNNPTCTDNRVPRTTGIRRLSHGLKNSSCASRPVSAETIAMLQVASDRSCCPLHIGDSCPCDMSSLLRRPHVEFWFLGSALPRRFSSGFRVTWVLVAVASKGTGPYAYEE